MILSSRHCWEDDHFSLPSFEPNTTDFYVVILQQTPVWWRLWCQLIRREPNRFMETPFMEKCGAWSFLLEAPELLCLISSRPRCKSDSSAPGAFQRCSCFDSAVSMYHLIPAKTSSYYSSSALRCLSLKGETAGY